MARFYQTGLTDFTEYETSRPGAVSTESVFGKLEALPEDRARLQEIVGGFDEQINQLADQLRRNPKAVQQLQPQIGQLRGSLRDQLQFGEIAAIQDRLKQYQTVEGGVRKTLADDPFLADQAIKRIQVNPLGFDQATRQYGKIDAPDVVKPFSANDKRQWRETAENTIKDRILGKVQDKTKLNATKSLLEVGETVGVSPEQVTEALLGQVTPEMIRSEQQSLRLRGMEKEADREANFYDPATGEFDKSTTYGAMLSSMVTALSRTNFKGNRLQVTDDAAKAAIDANKQLKVARGKSKLDKEDEAKIIAQKLSAVWNSRDKAFQGLSKDNTRKEDNWLQGMETKAGEPILGIEKPIGGQPIVKIQVLDEDGNPKIDYPMDAAGNITSTKGTPVIKEQFLDMDFVQTQFGAKTADMVKEYLGDEYDPERANINIDATKDLEGAELGVIRNRPGAPGTERGGPNEPKGGPINSVDSKGNPIGSVTPGEAKPALRGVDFLYE